MTQVWAEGTFRVTNSHNGAIAGGRVMAGLVTPSFSNDAMFILGGTLNTAVPKDAAEILRRKNEFTCLGGLPKDLMRECLRTGKASSPAPLRTCHLKTTGQDVVITWTTLKLLFGPMAPRRIEENEHYQCVVRIPIDKVKEFLR